MLYRANLSGANLTGATLKDAVGAIFCNTKTPWGLDNSGSWGLDNSGCK
jgi:uncharacterized protein YjbI with pentapeptide repeats